MPDAAAPDAPHLAAPGPHGSGDGAPPSGVETLGVETLDLIGLKCPLPALKTRKALSRLAPGARLAVRCTDPLAALDLPNLARETGDGIETLPPVEENGRTVLRFLFRRAGGGGA